LQLLYLLHHSLGDGVGDGALTTEGNWTRQLGSKSEQPRPALFLDRDGVLIEERNYLSDPDQVVLITGAAALIKMAQARGLAVVVVTNQSGIGRGFFHWDQHRLVEDRFLGLLAADGALVDLVLACPFHPEGRGTYGADHDWRKPRPGMFLAARRMLNIDLTRSVMVGDKTSDIEAASAAGLRRAIHVATGYGDGTSDRAAALSTNGFEVLLRRSVANVNQHDLEEFLHGRASVM
jgi:D-glycero-D-manno-heptose 1,7-bisphosphate phosphatase